MAFNFYEQQGQSQDQNQNQNQRRGGRGFTFTPKLLILALLVIIVGLTFSTGFFVVDQTEQAVILRFGKYLKTVGPGLQFKIPFGIDRSFNVETQTVQTMSFGYRATSTGNIAGSSTKYNYSKYMDESTMLTGDLNIVDIQWIVQYRIDDPYKWLFSDEIYSRLNHNYGGIPAKKDLQAQWLDEQKAVRPNIDWQVLLDAGQYADNPNNESWVPGYSEVWNEMEFAMASIISGLYESPEQVADDLNSEVQDILDEYWASK